MLKRRESCKPMYFKSHKNVYCTQHEKPVEITQLQDRGFLLRHNDKEAQKIDEKAQ